MKYSDKLYDMAFRLYDEAPWEEVKDTCLYAFLSRTTGEKIYVNFMGMRGEYLAMAAYIGEEGLQSIYFAAESGSTLPEEDDVSPDLIYSFNSQNCVQCAFVEKDFQKRRFADQTKSCKDYIRAHRKKVTGNMPVPTFINNYPFYNHKSVNEPERLAILEEALETAMVHIENYRDRYSQLPRLNPLDTVQIPYYTWTDGKWSLGYTFTSKADRTYWLEKIPFQDQVLEKRLRRLKRRGTVEVELIPFCRTVQDGDDEYFPECILMYHEEDDVLLHPLLQPHLKGMSTGEIWKTFLSDFSQKTILEELGELPKKIRYRGMAAFYLLQDFCKVMEIPLESADQFPPIDAFYMSMAHNDSDEEEMRRATEKVARDILNHLAGVPKSALKTLLPDQIKTFILDLPEGFIDEALYKEVKKYAKYL